MPEVLNPESFDYNQKCFCRNPDNGNYQEYEAEGSKYRYCRGCRSERREIVFSEENVGEEEPPTLDSSSKIQTSSIRIRNPDQARSDLKTGDHIAWTRKKGFKWTPSVTFSHHAIVISIGDHTIKIVHYAKEREEDKKRTIHEKVFQLCSKADMEYSFLFCIKYPPNLLRDNPPRIVIARALSRVGEKSYNLLCNNCESFASFCKRGVARSIQVSGNICKSVKVIGKCLQQIAQSPRVKVWTAEFLFAEGTEVLVEGIKQISKANVVGGVLYLLAEGFLCCVDIYHMFEARHDKRMTGDELKKTVMKRVLLVFYRAAVGIASSIGLGAAGFALGYVIGNVIVPVVGGAPGGAIGSTIGSVIGGVGGVATLEGSRTIAWSFHNSENITSIKQLQLGDHIILPGENFLHPRCHALVSELFCDDREEGSKNFLRVIRNDYKRGIFEEWIPFVEMKRIKYKVGESYTPDVVITRARRKLYEKKYNIAIYNCKTFATQQKMKEEMNF